MNTQARKFNLIENLILLKDEQILSNLEKVFVSLQQKKNISSKTKRPISAYKKSILSVSVWSDEDIKSLENNLKNFNTWKIEKW